MDWEMIDDVCWLGRTEERLEVGFAQKAENFGSDDWGGDTNILAPNAVYISTQHVKATHGTFLVYPQ